MISFAVKTKRWRKMRDHFEVFIWCFYARAYRLSDTQTQRIGAREREMERDRYVIPHHKKKAAKGKKNLEISWKLWLRLFSGG